MEKYKPTAKELKKLRQEEVRRAKEHIKSLNVGMGKFAKWGSFTEAGYLQEKMDSLDRVVKRMIKGRY